MKILKTLLFFCSVAILLISCAVEPEMLEPQVGQLWLSKTISHDGELQEDFTISLDLREDGLYELKVNYLEQDSSELLTGSFIHINADNPGWMEFVTPDGTTLKTWVIRVLDNFSLTVEADPFFADLDSNCTISFRKIN